MKPESSLVVTLRVRPMNHVEYKAGAKIIAHTVDNNLVVLLDPTADPDDILRANRSREKRFLFDHAFDQMASQTDIYEATMKDLIGDILSGFNVTVFAYGPTGAGKTHTMLGNPSDPGITALALKDLFDKINHTADNMVYNVTVSYLEIYNEMIRDLLDPTKGILELREDPSGETIVTGLSEMQAVSCSELMELLNKGNLCRTCEPTAANKTSSRSHAILKVTVRSKSKFADVAQEIHTGCLFLVDLAGSERASVTKNRGKRMVEGAHINRSLLALGNVINALAAQGKVSYVNFRDSKLTRILKESLCGNTKTVMISHISPASTAFEESRNTLMYAERSRSIKTKVHQNVHEVYYHVVQYQEIIAQLRGNISDMQKKLDACKCLDKNDQSAANCEDLCTQMTKIFSEQKQLRGAICALKYNLMQNAIETQKRLSIISEWKKLHEQSAINGTKCSNEPLPVTASSSEQALDKTETGSILNIDQIACSCTTTTVTNLEDEEVLQSATLVKAKNDLATLVGEKQRMEARLKRLMRQLTESDTNLANLQKELTLSIIPTYQQQYIQNITAQHDLQHTVLDRELAASLGHLRGASQEKTIEELKRQCLFVLDIANKQQALLKEHDVEIPADLLQKLQQIKIKQSLLDEQVDAIHQLWKKSNTTEPFAMLRRYSACTDFSLIQASKSNFLQVENEEEIEESNRNKTDFLQLPKIKSGPRTGWMPNNSQTEIAETKTSVSLPYLPDTYHSRPTKSRSFSHASPLRSSDAHLKQAFLKSFNTPRISVSRCSSGPRKLKYVIHQKQKEDLDIESVKTSSMSSLTTAKTPSHVANKKTIIVKNPHPSYKSIPSLKPKLSQTTRKKLVEARTSLTANESAIKSIQSTPTRKSLVYKTSHKKTISSVHSTPRKSINLPPVHKQTRSVLIPTKVTAAANFTSPYLSSITLKSKKTSISKKQLKTQH